MSSEKSPAHGLWPPSPDNQPVPERARVLTIWDEQTFVEIADGKVINSGDVSRKTGTVKDEDLQNL